LIRLQAYKLHFAGFFQDQRIGGSCWPYSHLFRFAGLFLAIFWPVGAENLCYLAGCTVDRWLIGPVAPENSIERLTCAIASRFDAVMVGWPGAAQDRLPC
jgi:hypothetical protein